MKPTKKIEFESKLAAGFWRTDEPPKDGTKILAMINGNPLVIWWYEDEEGECGWESDRCWSGLDYKVTVWAEIHIPH